MTDYLGKELAIGDYVVFVRQRYREFAKGQIIKFTDKNVRLRCLDSHGNPMPERSWCSNTLLQTPKQLIRITRG